MSSQEHPTVERVRSQGVGSAFAWDLLAIALSRRIEDVEGAGASARKILNRFRNLHGLVELAPTDIVEASGFDRFETLRFQSLMELGRRVERTGRGDIDLVDDPESAFKLLKWMADEKKEYFVALLLDAKNGVIREARIHVGTLTMSVVGPREVFREAIRDGASAIIVAHNHPSGDPTPSPEDIDVTRRLVEIGKMLDIPVLDHIIIGRTALSLQRRGYM